MEQTHTRCNPPHLLPSPTSQELAAPLVEAQGWQGPGFPLSHLLADPGPGLATEGCQWDGGKLGHGKVLGKSDAIIIHSLMFAWDGSHWRTDGGGFTPNR